MNHMVSSPPPSLVKFCLFLISTLRVFIVTSPKELSLACTFCLSCYMHHFQAVVAILIEGSSADLFDVWTKALKVF